MKNYKPIIAFLFTICSAFTLSIGASKWIVANASVISETTNIPSKNEVVAYQVTKSLTECLNNETTWNSDGYKYAYQSFNIDPYTNASKKFTTLNAALQVTKQDAENNPTVNYSIFVKPRSSNLTISGTHSIPKNVSFIVPIYCPINSVETLCYSANDRFGNLNDGFLQEPQTKITMQNNTKIDVYGNFILTGQIDGGNGGWAWAGNTYNIFTSLIMGANSQLNILNNSPSTPATLRTTGFISGDSTAKVTIDTNTKLEIPFVVWEHRGGTKLTGMSGGLGAIINVNLTISPFNRYFFQNIINVQYEIRSGSSLIALVDMQADEQSNKANVNFIGTTSSSFISLNTGTYITGSFNNSTKVNTLNFYGGFVINPLSIVVMNKELETSDVHFPISYLYDITLNTINGVACTVDTTSQDIKLLPGSSLVINPGVTVNGRSMMVYPAGSIHEGPKTETAAEPYPSDKAAAFLSVDGTLSLSALGGYVSTQSASGTITVSTSTSVVALELLSASLTSAEYYDKTTLYASGKIIHPLNSTVEVTTFNIGETYKSEGSTLDNAYWRSTKVVEKIEYTVSITTKSGSTVNVYLGTNSSGTPLNDGDKVEEGTSLYITFSLQEYDKGITILGIGKQDGHGITINMGSVLLADYDYSEGRSAYSIPSVSGNVVIAIYTAKSA